MLDHLLRSGNRHCHCFNYTGGIGLVEIIVIDALSVEDGGDSDAGLIAVRGLLQDLNDEDVQAPHIGSTMIRQRRMMPHAIAVALDV